MIKSIDIRKLPEENWQIALQYLKPFKVNNLFDLTYQKDGKTINIF